MPPSSEKTLAGSGAAKLVIDYLERQGVERSVLLAEVGLDSADLAPEARIPRSANRRLWEAASVRAGDPALGIHVAQFAEPGALGLVEYLARTARTLAEAVGQAERFSRLIHDGVTIEIAESEAGLEVFHRTLDGQPQPPAAADFVVAHLTCIARQLAGFSIGLRSVRLARPRPEDPAEWEQFYRCPVEFEGADSRATLDPAVAHAEIPNADSRLHDLLRKQAEQMESELPSPGDFLAEVRAAIRETLVTAGGRVDAVARRLGLSERTLRRRLSAADVTHTDLRDTVRRSLALELEGRARQVDIAAELGFASTSAYRRAFERWTGQSPRAWRSSREG